MTTNFDETTRGIEKTIPQSQGINMFPHRPYSIVTVGGSEAGKNNLLQHSVNGKRNVDKTHLYPQDLSDHKYNGGLTRNDLYDTICMTLIRFLYDSTNLNV